MMEKPTVFLDAEDHAIRKAYELRDQSIADGPGATTFCPLYGGPCDRHCPGSSEPFVIEQNDRGCMRYVVYPWRCMNKVVAEKIQNAD